MFANATHCGKCFLADLTTTALFAMSYPLPRLSLT